MSAHSHSSSTSKTDRKPAAKPDLDSASTEVDFATSPTSPTSDESTPPRTSPWFVIAFAIAATLPIGLGVGWACRVRSAPPAADSRHNESSTNEEVDSVSWAWRNQLPADDLFRAGDFGLALQHYQSKECADPLRPSGELSLKIALCHAALGQWEESLTILDSLLEHGDSQLREATLLVQSRIWLGRHDFERARESLRQLFSPPDEPRPIARPIAEEACYLLASACLLDEAAAKNESTSLYRPISSLHRFVWQAANALHLDPSLAAQSSEHVESGKLDAAQPTATPLGVETHDIVTQLLAATTADERRLLGDQLARQLLAKHSAARWMEHLKMVLAEAAYERSDLTESAAFYGEVSDRSSNLLAVIASFNEGAVQVQLHDYRNASRTLGRFIDGAPGHELRPMALILRGRALLELGDGELAAFEFARAADLSKRDDLRAWATAYMGMAYLQARKPMVAAQQMLLRRDRLQSDVAKAELGFVVSLARLEALKSPESRDREALFMLRALSAINPDDEWLGACGRLMLGQAYQHLGLIEQATEIYEHVLRQEIQDPFASEMKLALAECASTTGNSEVALNYLVDLQTNGRAPWATQAGLRRAKWELAQGHHDECLTICRELLQIAVDHAPILRLMGQAHESAGDFDQAAECYAGLALK